MPSSLVAQDPDFQGVNRCLNLAPASAPGHAMTFEQYDPTQVVDLIGNGITTNGAVFAPYLGANINGGLIAAGNPAAIDANRPYAVKFRSSATANSGCSVILHPVLRLLKPVFHTTWLNFNLLTTTTYWIGLHSNVAPAITEPTDGMYWSIVNGTVTAKIANNSVRSQIVGTPPTPTLGATDWFRFDVLVTPDVNNAANSTAVFTMRDKNLASVFSETLTGVNISTSRLVGGGPMAFSTVGSVTDLCHFHQVRTRIAGIPR